MSINEIEIVARNIVVPEAEKKEVK